MIRKIIRIDEEKCNGCGACALACHEGAIEIIEGKAKLVRENFCDGLGDCLPNCPAGAITFELREAPEYDEAAVKDAKMKNGKNPEHKVIRKINLNAVSQASRQEDENSSLSNWPVQIKLAPVKSQMFDGRDVVLAADCTAYAYENFHKDFAYGKTVLIGCTKLDAVDYAEKLAEIITENDIKSVTVVKMEVPCCRGMEIAVQKAVSYSKKEIPVNVVTISIAGTVLN